MYFFMHYFSVLSFTISYRSVPFFINLKILNIHFVGFLVHIKSDDISEQIMIYDSIRLKFFSMERLLIIFSFIVLYFVITL